MPEKLKTGVLVIGAGPAGCAAAVQCRRLGLEVTLVDSTGTAGGLVREARRIDNLPALEAPVSGLELAQRLTGSLLRFGIDVLEGSVTSVSLLPGGGFLSDTGDDPVRSRSVILATGTRPVDYGLAGDHPPVLRSFLDLPPVLRGLRIAVIGGGEAAFDYALHASDLGAVVDVLVRGSAPVAVGVLPAEAGARPSIRIRYITQVVEAHAEGSITVMHLISGNERLLLSTDAVLAAVGRERSLPVVPGEPMQIHGEGSVKTSIPGLFIAGDAALGAQGQAGSAIGQGLAAAAAVSRTMAAGR
jgi:thioredoxin reductase (NADPH)